MSSPRRFEPARVVCVLALAPLAVTVAGRLGGLHDVFDLASHFPLPSALALGLAAAALAWRRWWRAVAVCALALLVNVWLLVPCWSSAPATNGAAAGTVRLAALNVCYVNHDHAAAIRFIADSNAGVVAVSELTPQWRQALVPALATLYPHSELHDEDGCYGIGVWSRWPLRSVAVVKLSWSPAITAVVDTPHGPLSVLAAHTPRPFLSNARDCREAAADLLPRARALATPLVVFGDLNMTPWTSSMRTLLADELLVDAARGHGWTGSWPADLPWFLRIPIDHALVTRDVAVSRFEVGPDLGSDHRPIVLELVLPASKPASVPMPDAASHPR